MTTSTQAGVYLIIEFDWPRPLQREHGQKARHLHDTVQNQDWIKEILAGSGGVGAGAASILVYWLPDYAALDRLLKDQEDPVSQAYQNFFSEMVNVQDRLREQVVYLP